MNAEINASMVPQPHGNHNFPTIAFLVFLQTLIFLGFLGVFFYMLCVIFSTEIAERYDSLRHFPGLSIGLVGIALTIITQSLIVKCSNFTKSGWIVNFCLLIFTFVAFTFVNLFQLNYWRLYDHLGLLMMSLLLYYLILFAITFIFLIVHVRNLAQIIATDLAKLA